MQTVQLATAFAALIGFAAAFPGFGGTSHVSQSLGGGHGGFGGGFGGGAGHGGFDGGHEASHFPEYKYEYAVHDPHTGDVKTQHESRHGDQVKGSYSIADADGHLRTVEYTADKHNGFQAIVKKGGKVTLHGYGEQDEQNNAAIVAQAPVANHGGYSQHVTHDVSFGKGLGAGAGYGGSFGH